MTSVVTSRKIALMTHTTLYREISVSTAFLRRHDLQQRWQASVPDYLGNVAVEDDDTLAADLLAALALAEYSSYCDQQHTGQLGRHWTRSREYAFSRARSNADRLYSLVITATCDVEAFEDHARTGTGSADRDHYADEQETTLLANATLDVVALHLYGDPYLPPRNVLTHELVSAA